MKYALVLVTVHLACAVVWGSELREQTDARPVLAGEWSQPVSGLRARLLIKGKLPVVYVELQSVSNGVEGISLFCDRGQSIQCSIRDQAGDYPRYQGLIFLDSQGDSSWLTLYPTSSVLVRANVDGLYIPDHNGLVFPLPGGPWVIPKNNTNDIVLSATFKNATVPKRFGRVQSWEGRLVLPGIKVSPNPAD